MTWNTSFVHIDSPITADNDPNTTAPSADRIIRTKVPKRPGALGKALVVLNDGTSLDVTMWVRDATLTGLGGDDWIQISAATTLLPNVAQFIDVPPDALIFTQFTAPVGAPTTFALGFV